MVRLVTAWRRRLRRRLQPEKAALADLRSIFDAAWYGTEYPDLAAFSGDLFGHFLRHGIAEGRRPNRFFDAGWYGQHYPEAGNRLPLVRYALIGRAARHDPGPDFSAIDYLAMHTDIARARMDPLEHYIRFGHQEGRQILPSRLALKYAGGATLAAATLPNDIFPEDLRLPLGVEETALRLATRFRLRGTPITLIR